LRNSVFRTVQNFGPEAVRLDARPSQQHIPNGERILNQYLRFATLAILFASVSLVAHADTLTLETTSGVLNPSGTAFIFPYSFSINGSSTLVDMMCLNDNREVTAGESWQADPSAVTKDSPIKDQIAAQTSSVGLEGTELPTTMLRKQSGAYSTLQAKRLRKTRSSFMRPWRISRTEIPVRLITGNTRSTRLRMVRRAKVGYRRTLSAQLTVLHRGLQCLSRQHYS
jgi:hypothetical protein